MKIIVFEAENVKRLKAATIQPKPDGSDRGAVEIFIEDGAVFSETENQPVSEEM